MLQKSTFNSIKYFSSQQKATKEVYDLVIVGGGCSTFALLLNAFRNDKLKELAGKNGICIIEKSDRFGGGTLEENLIPSNTHSIGLLRYIMGEKQAEMLPSHFEAYLKEGIPQSGKKPLFDLKRCDNAVLPCFQELLSTQVYEHLKQKREQTASLQMFGYFLRLAGNQFLKHTYENNFNLQFKPNFECVEFFDKHNKALAYGQQQQEQETDNFYKLRIKGNGSNEGTVQDIYGKNIVMAIGGHQKYNSMYSGIPQEKRILCEQFLKQEGFLKALDLIEKNPDAPISIIGGSHSGFSSIYMLLYGADTYESDEMSLISDYSQSRQNIDYQKFGNISPLEISERIKNYKCKLNKRQIKIFHRGDIRISYANQNEAVMEGYTNWDQNCVHKLEGCVNPYTGLRGLTKKLYEDIRDNKEKRGEIIQFTNLEEIQSTLDESSVVIECLGYYSNTIPFQTERVPNFQYTFDTDKFVKMDGKHRIQDFEDVYGMGLGYGLHTHDDLIGAENLVEKKVRADSLQVYLSRLSSKILNSMLPK